MAEILKELPIDIQDRFGLVKQAGYQVGALTELMRTQIVATHMAEHYTEGVALSLMLDRLQALSEIIAELGAADAERSQDDLGAALSLSAEVANG